MREETKEEERKEATKVTPRFKTDQVQLSKSETKFILKRILLEIQNEKKSRKIEIFSIVI